MPYSKAIFFTSLFLGGLLMAAACFAQPVSSYLSADAARRRPAVATPNNTRPVVAETCGNGVDDDGNGLTDDKDFSCYYSSSTGGCKPSSVVWACSATGLYWVDPQAGTTRYVASLAIVMEDLAWASNGKLYGMNNLAIYEIDPYTGQILSTTAMPAGYLGINAMTADGQGNLYVTVFINNAAYVARYTIATGQMAPVVNITAANLISAGDLSFLNGYLYLSCGSNKLARINSATGDLHVINFSAPVICSGFGLTTLGDGYLYITGRNDLYRLDMTTLQTGPAPYFTFPFSQIDVPFGLSTYADHCNAPSCSNPAISVTGSGQPYCTHPGVALSASGAGITGESAVDWSLPDGSRAVGPTFTATLSGLYTVRYHNVPDNCGHDTSFSLTIFPTPNAALGHDTLICPNATLRLAPLDAAGISSWLWQDGSTAPYYIATVPGVYRLQVSGPCGVSQAGIIVQPAPLPRVALPDDTELCSFDSLLLTNALHADGFHYRWQNGSTEPQLMAYGPGIYWVDVSTQCGSVRDSIVITPKRQGCDLRVAVPNAFSPGGNSNMLFRPVITGPLLQYEFMVYDRWGQLVFHTTNRSMGWDGRVNGGLQPAGMFVWNCVYRFSGQPAKAQKGTVLLVR